MRLMRDVSHVILQRCTIVARLISFYFLLFSTSIYTWYNYICFKPQLIMNGVAQYLLAVGWVCYIYVQNFTNSSKGTWACWRCLSAVDKDMRDKEDAGGIWHLLSCQLKNDINRL